MEKGRSCCPRCFVASWLISRIGLFDCYDCCCCGWFLLPHQIFLWLAGSLKACTWKRILTKSSPGNMVKHLVGLVGSALARPCRGSAGVHSPSCGGGPGWSGETPPHGKDLGAESGFFRRRCLTCEVSRASEVAQ